MRMPAVVVAAVAALASGVLVRANAGVSLTDVSAAAGITVTHANGAAGKKYLPETMGSGAAFVDVDGDGDQDLIVVSGVWTSGSSYARLFRNDGRGRFAEATAGSGCEPAFAACGRFGAAARRRLAPPGRSTAWASRPATTTTTARPTSCSPRSAAAGCFATLGGGTFADVDGEGRARRPARVQHVGDVVRLRQGRPSRSADLQLRAVDAAGRRLLQRRRQDEELLHAGGLSRQHVVALSQQGRRHLRRRHRQGRLLRRDVEVARRDAARLRPGRLARRLHRQRHAAEQALSQQRQRHLRRAGAEGRRGVQRGRPGPRRDGRRRGRSRRIRAPHRGRDQLLRRDARPVPRRVRRPVRRSRARLGHRPRDAPDARLGLLLLRRRSRRPAGSRSSSTDASTPRASRPALRPASPPTRRTCSATPTGASPTSRATPARRSRSRRWAAAPPSPTSTPTAISTP